MMSTRFFVAAFLAIFAALCDREIVPTPNTESGDSAAGEVEQTQSSSREVVRIDLTECRGDELRELVEQARDNTAPMSIDLTWSKVNGELLERLRGLVTVRELYLFGTEVDDDDLSHVGDLPNLEAIDLGGCNVTPSGVLHLRSSRQLKHLHLSDFSSPLDEATMEQIATAWPHLQSLSLDGAQIADSAFAHVGKLRQLRYLNICRTQVTDEGLKTLGTLTRLTTLHAGNTKISDLGMDAICSLSTLEKLDLNFTGITDRGLQGIDHLMKLKRIYFVGTEVTDAGLEHLKPLDSLVYIGLSDHNSLAAVEALKEALPLYKANKGGG